MEPMGPLVFCETCGMAMYLLRQGGTWEGDWEISSMSLECRETGCQTSAEVVYRRFIPIDVARRAE